MTIEKTPLEATIAHVTVYSDRALVTRRARIELQSGARELVLENLPANLDTDSIRARGQGEIAVKIIGVESQTVFLSTENQDAARNLQRELDGVEAEGALLGDEIEVLEQRLKTLEEMAHNVAVQYAKTLAAGETSLQATGETLDFLQTQSVNVHRERTALEARKRDNAARQIALRGQVQQFQNGRQKQAQKIIVAIEASGAGAWNLEVSYVVFGARWKPLYDVRALLSPPPLPENELAGTIQLSYLASITQSSGEDWPDAMLTLSTAQPSLGSLPPKLAPLYVSNVQTMPAPKMSRARHLEEETALYDLAAPALTAEAAPMEMMRKAVSVTAEIETATTKTEGATVTFELPRPFSVPSDGQPHRAQIAQEEFAGKFDYFAIPRRSETAYLRATIQNRALSLLAGEANIFRDDTFVGKTPLDAIAPHEEWQIFLGPDEQVQTHHELERREVDKNFIGNVRRQNFGYKIASENLKAHRVHLELLDQIPVSRHEQIKVKLKHAEPAPHADEMGILKWELTLDAHSEREVHFETGVESPRDMNVIGLED